MRRKLLLLLLWLPVPMMTAFFARMFSVLPLFVAVIPMTRPGLPVSRTMLVILCCSRICAPSFLAEASIGLTGTMPDEVVGLLVRARLARPGLRLRPLHGGGMIFARSGISRGVRSGVVRSFVNKHYAVCDQPIAGCRAVVREGADDFLVVVSVIRKTVGLHDDQFAVREQQVSVNFTPFLLPRGSSAEHYCLR